MGLVNLGYMLQKARREGYAVAAFNIDNFQTARTAVLAAESLRSPLILQTAVATVKSIGAAAMIGFLRPLAGQAKVPVAIQLDHCTDSELALQCAALGWSSIMFDQSKKDFEENKEKTREMVRFCHDRDVSVEGELGAIAGTEGHIVVAEHEASLADPVSSAEYCRETGIDAFAPAVGTAHGVYKGEPKVEFDLLRTISDAVSCPTVIHGGTGLSDEAFRTLIRNGAAKINISTALKMAYYQAVYTYTHLHPDDNDPLKLDTVAGSAVREVFERHIRLFGSDGKA